ncbi:MAG: DUF4185 domain-containing protein [Mycobacterium sp.]
MRRAGRFLLICAVAVLVALGLGLFGGAPAMWHASPEVTGAAPLGCLDTALTRYANSGEGWTGGDSAWSTPLPGDRQLFAFSDSFLGPITPPSRPRDAAFVHNSFVVRDARGQWSTVVGGTPGHPAALVAPADPAHWFWLGAVTDADGALQVPLSEWTSTGTGPMDFRFIGSSLARFDGSDLRAPPSITPLPRSRHIQWGQWVQPDSGWTYVYGVESAGGGKYLHVARVQGADLRRAYSYWTGRAWSAAESESSRVTDGVSAELSVHRVRGGVYMLTTMQGGELSTDRLVGRFGPAPTGPFGPPVTLYRTPESGRAGLYRDSDVYTYNAHVHPEFSTPTSLVISYDVNSLDTAVGGDLYRQVSIYRPRFVLVSLRWNGEPDSEAGAAPGADAGSASGAASARRPCV